MGVRRSGLAGAVATVLLAGCGLAAAQQPSPPPRTASYAAIQGFLDRAEQALGRRFTASYRISLFKRRGRVFRGRVYVSNWSRARQRFLEMPAFSGFNIRYHAYEVFAGPNGYVNCSQASATSRWFCISEKGEGMGGMWVQNGAIAPQAFVDGLSEAVGALAPAASAPSPMFLSRATIDRQAVRCLSIGNAHGAVGRVCTTDSGLVVSYRMSESFSPAGYASAELVSYSMKVNRRVLTPPAKPSCPACDPRPKRQR